MSAFRPDDSGSSRRDGSERPALRVAAEAGWALSGSVIGCLLIGYLIGRGFDWNPGATVAGLFIGIVVGLYNLAKAMGLNR